jgi:hypothetical protein
LRAFLSLLSRRGTGPLSLADYAAAVSPPTDRALRAAGIIKPDVPSRIYPCGADEPGCVREVRGFDDDDDLGLGDTSVPGERTLVAVCSRTPHACPFTEVSTDALAQVAIHKAPLVRVVVRALGIEETLRPHRKAVSLTDYDLLPLGELLHDGPPRDAFLFIHPRSGLELRLSLRAHDPRRAVFFVPTAHAVDPDLFARHPKTAHVELARLDDRLTVRGESIVGTTQLRLVTAVDAPADDDVEPLVTDARPLPPLKRWNLLRICKVNGETVLLTVEGVSSRRSYIDMGMANANREADVQWKLFIDILENEGVMAWHEFGNYIAVSQRMTRLRKALCRALGLGDDPFESVGGRQGWRPRFIAKKDPPPAKLRGRR